jgi:hypothetical protein
MKRALLPIETSIETLVQGIKVIIEKARIKTVHMVNHEMLLTYWESCLRPLVVSK